MVVKGFSNLAKRVALLGIATLVCVPSSYARDVEYQNSEVSVYVNANEPTQIQFPGAVAGGFKKKGSSLSLDKRDTDLIVFASERLAESGEAIIVRLTDGRSYSIRVHRSGQGNERDDVVRLEDKGTSIVAEDDSSGYKEEFRGDKAPPTQVSGLMREMVLAAEFGKATIPGYRVSERHKGQTVLNDGAIEATIEKIFIGPNLWGYVLNTKNLLDQTQLINPATFRLDGTRAVSASNWELAPRPLNIEEQIAGKHDSKMYIVTRAR